MEYVPFCFMEAVIENVFFRTAQDDKVKFEWHSPHRTYSKRAHFSQIPAWWKVARKVSKKNRYVKFTLEVAEDSVSDVCDVATYSTQVCEDHLYVPGEEDRRHKPPCVVTRLEVGWTRSGSSNPISLDKFFKWFECTDIGFSSSTEATFYDSYRQNPIMRKIFLKTIKTGATVIYPTNFALSELIDLKREHGLRRNQLNLKTATADYEDLAELHDSVSEFDFEDVILNTMPCEPKVGYSRTLKLTIDPKNAAEILQIMAQQSAKLTIIGALPMYRDLSQCEKSRTALIDQFVDVHLNEKEDNLESVRFVVENFDSTICFYMPPDETNLTSFRNAVWKLAEETSNVMTTYRAVGVNCMGSCMFNYFEGMRGV